MHAKEDMDIIDHYPPVDIVRTYYKDYKARERLERKYEEHLAKTEAEELAELGRKVAGLMVNIS